MVVMKLKRSIKKNDKVLVTTGRDKGKIGKVLKVDSEKTSLLVEKVNIVKRHTRVNKAGQGGIIEKESFLHISNVMIICEYCNKPTRVGHKILENGNNVRFCKKCDKQLDK